MLCSSHPPLSPLLEKQTKAFLDPGLLRQLCILTESTVAIYLSMCVYVHVTTLLSELRSHGCPQMLQKRLKSNDHIHFLADLSTARSRAAHDKLQLFIAAVNVKVEGQEIKEELGLSKEKKPTNT